MRALRQPAMGLWSAKRTLATGEMLKLEADYGISRSKS